MINYCCNGRWNLAPLNSKRHEIRPNSLYLFISLCAYLCLLLEKLDDPRFDSAIQDSRKYWETFLYIYKIYRIYSCRSRWQCGLRRISADA